jgi:hypothetical protein
MVSKVSALSTWRYVHILMLFTYLLEHDHHKHTVLVVHEKVDVHISSENLRPLDTQCKHTVVAVFLLFLSSTGQLFLSHNTGTCFSR